MTNPDKLTPSLILPSARSIMRNYIALALTLILLGIFGLLLFFTYHPPAITLAPLQKLIVPWIMSVDRLSISPAPRERFIFLALLLLSPLLIIAASVVARKAVDIFHLNTFQSPIVQSLLLAIPFGIILVCNQSVYVVYVTWLPWFPFWIACALAAIVFIQFFYRSQAIIYPLTRAKKRYFLLFLLVAAILQAITWRIVDFRLINAQRPWVLHFDAVFYSVAQVASGKTLLLDLPAQYGLYAEILKPLFTVIPLSVLSFTIILAVLQIIALLALGQVLTQTVRSPWLLLLCFLILLDITAETWSVPLFKLYRVSHYPEPYFQYWPMRFIFPAISLWAFCKLLRHFYWGNVVLLAAIGALAVMWNVDSGIPIVGAFLFFLVCQVIFPSKSHSRIYFLKLLALSLAVISVLWLLFFLYLSWKADQPLNFLEILTYQNIFYHLGFAKISLPRTPHPWMIFICCYLFGMVIAFTAWINQRPSNTAALIFYLSILGLGLFMYYQGRAHDLNLFKVSWPVILLVTLLSDRLLRLVKLNRFPQSIIYFNLPIVLLGVFVGMHLIWQLPTYGLIFYKNWHTILIPEPSVTGENIDFIKRHVTNRKSVAIFASNQSTYYAETGLGSAVSGPGFEETILQKDFDSTINQLIKHPVDHLFLGPTYYSAHKIQKDFNILFQYYDVKAKNVNGILYLTPK